MNRVILSIMIVFALSSAGCEKKEPLRYTQGQAEQKFLKICNEENKLQVKLFNVDKTVWIYLPMEEDLIDYHGTMKNDELKSKKQFNIGTFEGEYKDKQYKFLLDMTEGIKTSKDPGYKSDASETFIKNRLTIYGAISEAYFDINELPGDREFADKQRNETRQKMLETYIPKGSAPEFMVIVVANIKKGIAYKSVLNLEDYKKYRSEVLTSDEYNMREISELYGDAGLINDMEGKSLEIKPITWSWFFIEQVKNRVNFKFTRSDFPPSKDKITEIATIIAETFRYYEYADYSDVMIENLQEKMTYSFTRPQIISFEEIAAKANPPTLKMKYLLSPASQAQ
ncbi:MAG: hypothetical protein KA403_07280 [Candidatus Omnitrophica bacterium]|nr:hypothetical protein [Candidatus Omnitrophota bacterium]